MDSLLPIFKFIYPIKEPSYIRDRPLQVLCLGLSRSGTESLSKALTRLEFNDVYHGLQLVAHRINEIPQWYRLAKAKQNKNNAFLCREQFDKVIGHCMAVTDTPCCCFGPELMRCYPDAKVVLNRRADSAAWEKSIRATLVDRFSQWWAWMPLWLERDLFWTGLLRLRVFKPLMIDPLVKNPEGMARQYEKHYLILEELCQAQGRDYLVWGPEDGWDPLCRFLGKDIPGEPFPEGNTPADMQEFSKTVTGPRMQRAFQRMRLLGGFIAAVAMAFGIYRGLEIAKLVE